MDPSQNTWRQTGTTDLTAEAEGMGWELVIRFFSVVGYYKMLNIVPCVLQHDLVYLFHVLLL